MISHSWASFQKYYLPAPQTERGINSFPSLDVNRNPQSPFFNRLHVAWADGTQTCCPLNSFRLDVYSSFSTDGGTVWSNRVRVNDDPVDWASTHFFPWLAVDQSDGTVNVAWYDNRNDPVDAEQVQIFYARSSNGGTSFEANLNLMDNGVNFLNAVNTSDEHPWSNLGEPEPVRRYLGVAAANRRRTSLPATRASSIRRTSRRSSGRTSRRSWSPTARSQCSRTSPTAALSGGIRSGPAAFLGTNATAVTTP
jgi:hypothetical protein